MLKIYRAYSHEGVVLQKGIPFISGVYDTGYAGFGNVLRGNVGCECQTANYELVTLSAFEECLKSVKVIDGYVQNFRLWMPASYDMLEERCKDLPKDEETYKTYHLNEEAILLFTEHVYLTYKNNELVKKVFGRVPSHGMYILKPGAMVTMMPSNHQEETYEVFQSQSLGKQLVLSKLDRKI